MIQKNWVPCYLRIHKEEPELVKVLRDTISYSGKNDSLIVLDKADGIMAKISGRRLMKKGTKPVPVDAERVALIPCGVNNGLKNKNAIGFICTARDICHDKLLEEFNLIYNEKKVLENRIEGIKGKIDEYVKKVKEEKGEVPLTWSQLQEEIKGA